jgi:hypothetical protein
VRSDDVLKDVAARLKKRKELDPDVVKNVIESLLLNDDPVGSVDALDTQLYKIAMRRAEKR